MQAFRQNLLANTSLAQKKHADVRTCSAFESLVEVTHGRSATSEYLKLTQHATALYGTLLSQGA